MRANSPSWVSAGDSSRLKFLCRVILLEILGYSMAKVVVAKGLVTSMDIDLQECRRVGARMHVQCMRKPYPCPQPELGGLMNCSHWSIKSDQFLKPYLDLPTFLILFAMFVTSFAGSVSASERDQQMHKK